MLAAMMPLAMAAQVAQVGDAQYATLGEAFAAADEGSTITLLTDTEVSEMIPVAKSVTLNANGHNVTNNVTGNRMFRLSGVTFTLNGDGAHFTTPETNTQSYGFVDFRDASGTASADARFVATDATFKGGTDDGSLFAFRGNGQSIELNNVDVDLTSSNTYSIINGYKLAVDVKVNGGKYVCNSTNATAGVFQAGAGSTIAFDGVSVESSVGPIFEVIRSEATFKDCTMTNTADNSYFASCVSASNGADVTIDGGEYTANYPVYVYNSGGHISITGGTFNGKKAAIKVDDTTTDAKSSVDVTGGTFDGALQIGTKSELKVAGGTFSADVKPYVAESSNYVATATADGTSVYVVLDTTPDNVEAFVGTTPYATLAEAFAAAQDGETIALIKDTEVSEMIPVTKSVTLNANGHNVTNNVTGNRMFRLSGVTFTLNGDGAHFTTPETNTQSYGFVDFRDASGTASADARFVATDATFKGGTDDGSLFAFRGNGQSIELNNVDVDLTSSNTYSIINGYKLAVDVKVNGGKYVCNSTNATAGVFQAGAGSTIAFDGVSVESSVGPIFEVIRSEATFKDCTMTNTADNSYFASCVSASNGADVTIDGGEYTANYPVYVYNSGGHISITGGTFNGKKAAIKVDDTTTDAKSSVDVTGGTFDGALQIGTQSELKVAGGTFSDAKAADYCVDGYKLGEMGPDGMYEVVPNIVSGIEGVAADATGESADGKVEYFNLQGQRVANPAKGIFIEVKGGVSRKVAR